MTRIEKIEANVAEAKTRQDVNDSGLLAVLIASDIPYLLAEVKRMREALVLAEETFRLMERKPHEDTDYGEEVRRLGDRIGYGALMTSAQASWRKSLKENDWPIGGEFVAGPCYSTVLSVLKTIRTALKGTQS